MKWIEELPEGFSKEFVFKAEGVDNADEWLTENMGLGEKDWGSPVALSREEMLNSELLVASLTKDDVSNIEAVPVKVGIGQSITAVSNATLCICLYESIRTLHIEGKEVPDKLELPPLPFIQNLRLHGAKFTKDISALSALKTLRFLEISLCESLEDISAISGLDSLIQLKLNDCDYFTELTALTKLKGIELLDLGGCRSISSLKPLTNISGLKVLNLRGCDFIRYLDPLKNMSLLVHLDLTGCTSVKELKPISSLTSLKNLSLYKCVQISDLSALQTLLDLESLNLDGLEKLYSIEPLSSLHNLRELDLKNCVGLHNLSPLKSLIRLETLYLRGQSACDLRPMESLQKLKRLTLSGLLELTDLAPLGGLENLEFLDLSGCLNISDVRPIGSLVSLKEIDLSHCKSLEDLSPFVSLKKLLSLNIEYCPFLDSSKTKEILSGLYDLRTLKGVKEPNCTEIVWNLASKRYDEAYCKNKLAYALELASKRELDVASFKASLIDGFAKIELDRTHWGQIMEIPWTVSEWAQILSISDNILDPFADEFDLPAEEMDLQLAAGFIRAVALGASWDVAKGHLKRLLSDFGSMELWNTSATDMLLALRNLGMQAEEEAFLKRFTEEARLDMEQSIVLQLALGMSKAGKVDEALAHIDNGLLKDEFANQLLLDVIERWASEMPDRVAEWILEVTDKALLQKILPGIQTDKVLSNAQARKQMLMMQYEDRAAFLALLVRLSQTMPDDPWVSALLAELQPKTDDMKGSASSMAQLLSDDMLLDYVKGKKLSELRGRMEEEDGAKWLEQQALASYLLNEGLIDDEERSELLGRWRKES